MISNKKISGFTLLEVLVALGLTSILLSGIFLLINQSATLWRNGAETIENNESDIIAINFIRKILEDAKPVDWIDSDKIARQATGSEKIFEGKSNEIYFAAPLPVHDGQEFGLYLFSFSAGYSKEYQSNALIVSYRPINWESLDDTLSNEASSEAILTTVEGFLISYFGVKDDEDKDAEPSWSNSWEAQSDLPLAVRFSIKRAEASDDNDVPVDLFAPDDLVIRLPHKSLR